MNSLTSFAAERLSGWDFLIAGIIVLIVEYAVKLIFKKASEKTWNIVMKVSPPVLGMIGYLAIALVQKQSISTSVLHGLFVGLTAMGSYDVILKTMKETGSKSMTDANTAVEKALKEEK